MSPEIPGVIAIVLYMVSTGIQFLSLSRDIPRVKSTVNSLASIAVLCHAVTVYMDLYGTAGINLGIYPMLSLMAVSIAAIVLASSFRRPLANLFIAIFPLAAISLLLELFVQGSTNPRSDITPGILSHIVLSVVAYSLLTIAALQAALLSFGDYEMKHRNLGVLQRLPPLQTMDALLFETLWVGLVFLSLSITSGFIFLEDIGGPGLIHHTVITLAAWLVFAVLLWGRYRLGWRGSIASRWALTGFGLLAVGYFGSKLVLEIILERV
ncbi:MAG: cytochrome c biogenesis protein CcsA [Gammaproteobacteria bacterium]|nr:cytochrome c biogenesis protein CcsA [Gammaproteobacteria bacterium]